MRTRPADLLAGAASLVLLVSTFLEWYSPRDGSEALNAWEAFSIADVLIAVVVALGLALLGAQVAGRGPTLPVGLTVVTTTVTIAVTLVVLYRLLDQPGPNELIEVRAGAWVGLAAVAAIAAGAWGALADERPRPSDPPPLAVERRPAPPRS